jgi:hypothetical protein
MFLIGSYYSIPSDFTCRWITLVIQKKMGDFFKSFSFQPRNKND